ncbi:MAG: hypothetical protein AAGI06_05985 [Pseudomonadota bacterium]
MTKATELDRLKDVLDAYGAKPDNWPQDEREQLQAIASAHGAEVAAWLEEARQMDAVLNLVPDAQVPDGAVERMLAKVAVPPRAPVVDFQAARARRSMPRRWIDLRQAVPVGIAMAASLMVGVLAGLSDLTATYIPNTGTISLASVGQETIGDTLIGFETFTLAEGDLK